ncbi:MAG: triose-phosphate isomerase [Chitinophagaceae bacterium]
MRKKIVAGNWKMNLLPSEGNTLIQQIVKQSPPLKNHQSVLFCVPYTHLHQAEAALVNAPQNFILGAQNCSEKASGAFTGDVSIAMLKAFHTQAVIIGHSERRQYHQESHDLLKAKVDALIQEDMLVIFCCGEPLEIRETNQENDFVSKQLADSLWHVTSEQLVKNIVIAYEPIWAIGTGKTASAQQAQAMHAHIRQELAAQYSDAVAQQITILYGGSCNAENAKELFSQADIDGGLIGGAALKADSFLPIIQALN